MSAVLAKNLLGIYAVLWVRLLGCSLLSVFRWQPADGQLEDQDCDRDQSGRLHHRYRYRFSYYPYMDMGRKWQYSVPVRVICVENRWCVTLLHAVMRIRMNYYTDPEILHMDPDPRKQILISIFSPKLNFYWNIFMLIHIHMHIHIHIHILIPIARKEIINIKKIIKM